MKFARHTFLPFYFFSIRSFLHFIFHFSFIVFVAVVCLFLVALRFRGWRLRRWRRRWQRRRWLGKANRQMTLNYLPFFFCSLLLLLRSPEMGNKRDKHHTQCILCARVAWLNVYIVLCRNRSVYRRCSANIIWNRVCNILWFSQRRWRETERESRRGGRPANRNY